MISTLVSLSSFGRTLTEERILVGGRLNGESAVGMEREPGPARTLDGGGSSVKLLLEVVNAAERVVNRVLEGTILENTADIVLVVSGAIDVGAPGRSHVLPEKGMIDMT